MASGLRPAGNGDKDEKGTEEGRSAGWDQIPRAWVWPATCPGQKAASKETNPTQGGRGRRRDEEDEEQEEEEEDAPCEEAAEDVAEDKETQEEDADDNADEYET